MNLKKRLIISFGSILSIAWLIIAFWVWHETSEQIEIMTNPDLSNAEKMALMNIEVQEIYLAVTIPIFVVMLIVWFLIISITNRFVMPFSQLAEQLHKRNELNLNELNVHTTSKESEIIVLRLNQLLERITERLEYEKQFTADVAHELRTPLAGMRLNLELMDDVPEKPLFIAKIDELLVTIERLLQFARASHELHSDQAYQFNVYSEIIEPLKAEYEGNYPNHLAWDVPQDLMLKGDPSLIYLLMKNLLDNAKFYAADGKETVVLFQEKVDRVELTIIDNGNGIHSNQLLEISQPYKRSDETRNGFGLGLNIVDRIVRAHDAKMIIRNRTDGETGLVIMIKFNR
ncbi:ATP-binding protein [Wohlfahrtiimonas larvae]|uniref:histidine kinase n=1 Tax=Wohlfahrtiimonas larvae TaxID=1157986 RepID=A0ABP9MIN8_9GAMM|nr:ATP-binding protein [Wohlfahrtiimonas larvae]